MAAKTNIEHRASHLLQPRHLDLGTEVGDTLLALLDRPPVRPDVARADDEPLVVEGVAGSWLGR